MTEGKIARIQYIETQGCSVEAGAMRLRLVKEVMGARVGQKADYAILNGCHAPFRFWHLKSFIDLLEKLGVSYSFLSKEFCCGSSYLPKSLRVDDEIRALEVYAHDYEGKNLTEAEKLGAKAVVTFCANCNARYNRYKNDNTMPVLYWADLILDHMDSSRLDAQVDFYEGCHRDQNSVLPDIIDPKTSKALLDKVKGLEISEVSSDICCKQKPQDIFAAMKTKRLVTPTSCCYSNLFRTRPEGVRVQFLTEVLHEALN